MDNINFTQTFKPEKQYISGILKIAKDSTAKNLKEISFETGIPTGECSGKVLPHIEYAKLMGLIDFKRNEDKYSLVQTDLGKIIFYEDSNLMETLTILLLHLMMVREVNGAPIWNKMFSYVIPKYKQEELSYDNAIKELEFFYGDRINRKNFAPFLNSYKDIFIKLDFFDFDKTCTRIKLNNNIEDEYLYVFMYAILIYCEEKFPNRIEITADEFKEINFSNKLLCDSDTEYTILESLCDNNLIALNRQLNPFTIVFNAKKEDVLELLYSKLI